MKAVPHLNVCLKCRHCSEDGESIRTLFCKSLGIMFAHERTKGRKDFDARIHPDNHDIIDVMMRDGCPFYLENLVSE